MAMILNHLRTLRDLIFLRYEFKELNRYSDHLRLKHIFGSIHLWHIINWCAL